tara:strand:- start:56 stop:265 length:210 start_codon:yes stop_codon:yes gene_type:complete
MKFTATPFSGEVDEGLLRGSFKNGKVEGNIEYYSENGQLQNTGYFKNGKREGSWVTLYGYGTRENELYR